MDAQVIPFPVPAAFQKPVDEQPALIDLPLPERDPRPLCRCMRASSVRWGNELFCSACALQFLSAEGEHFFTDVLHTREIEYVKERGTLDEQLAASLEEMSR